MKKFVLTTLAALVSAALSAQVYTEASDLTLIGKIIGTPNPYHRVDTVRYKGFTKAENLQVRCPAGIAVLFRTDSPSITIQAEGDFSYQANNTMRLASHGFDLYIRKDGEWLWAAACCPAPRNPQAPMDLIKNMAPGVKECLLYLPIYSELTSVKIGVEEGRMLVPMESPFRHRVAIFGSSYTHGISTSRAGMSYPDQFTRHTGIQMLPLGCSGNCKMQFADVLVDVEADAFVFDAFSNPNAKMIEERLFPFIERLQAAHPGKPLIFQQTIRREKRNFDTAVEATESAKQHMADSLMKIAVKRYKDVYYVKPSASTPLQESSVDGIHPDDYGYYCWSRSIEKPLLRILLLRAGDPLDSLIGLVGLVLGGFGGFEGLIQILLDLRGVLQFLLGLFHVLLGVADALLGRLRGLLGLADLLLGGADGLLGGLQAVVLLLQDLLGILEPAFQGLDILRGQIDLGLVGLVQLAVQLVGFLLEFQRLLDVRLNGDGTYEAGWLQGTVGIPVFPRCCRQLLCSRLLVANETVDPCVADCYLQKILSCLGCVSNSESIGCFPCGAQQMPVETHFGYVTHLSQMNLQFCALRHLITYLQIHITHVGDNHKEEQHREDKVGQRRGVQLRQLTTTATTEDSSFHRAPPSSVIACSLIRCG